MLGPLIESIIETLNKKGKRLRLRDKSILTELSVVGVFDKNDYSGVKERIAAVTSRMVTFIKETVRPLAMEYAKLVEDDIARYIGNKPFSNLVKVNVSVPAFVTELINRNDMPTLEDRSRLMSLSETVYIQKPNDIRAYLQGGYETLDGLIAEFAKGVSDATLNRVWETFFASIGPNLTQYANLGQKTSDYRYGNDLFVAFIIARSLLNNPPETVTGKQSAYDMAIYMTNLRLGIMIRDFVTTYDTYKERGTVVYNYTEDYVSGKDFIITVHQENYDAFINDGGNPEVVYGAVLSDDTTGTIGLRTLTDNRDKYIAEWNSFYNGQEILSKLRETDAYRMAYVVNLAKLMNESVSVDMKEFMDIDVLEDTNGAVKAFLDTTDYKDMTMTKSMAIKIVAGLLYRSTNAMDFFRYMKQYENVNPNITPEEAATYAQAEIVTDYIVDQFIIEDI